MRRIAVLALLALAACDPHQAATAGGAMPAVDGATSPPDGAVPAADGAVAPSDAGIPDDWAVLTWTAPTTNTDGTPLTDLAGYFVYHGMVAPISVDNSTKLDVGDVTTYTFMNLVAGTHYFAVSTYDSAGNESPFSMEAQKTVP